MKRIITISREFGSGGRSIGKMLAEKMGYQYYDKELIERVVQKTNLSEEFVGKSGEYAPSANLFSYAFVGRNRSGMSVDDYLWKEQKKIILELAEEGNCVIVGRCADYILRNRTDCLNVFIHADKQFRAERIVKLYGETDKNPEKRLMDKDKKRAINYQYYTDQRWGVAENYHISLDSSEFGLSACVNIIMELAQADKEKNL